MKDSTINNVLYGDDKDRKFEKYHRLTMTLTLTDKGLRRTLENIDGQELTIHDLVNDEKLVAIVEDSLAKEFRSHNEDELKEVSMNLAVNAITEAVIEEES